MFKKIKTIMIGVAASAVILACSSIAMADQATTTPTAAPSVTAAPKTPSFKELLDSLGKIDINNALANEAKIKELKEQYDKMSEEEIILLRK